MKSPARCNTLLEIVLVACLISLTSYALSLSAVHTFDLEAWSWFIDAGYRVYSGQKIYVNFAWQTGPIYPYLHALFFWIAGFGGNAIILHICTMSAIATICTYLLSRRYTGIGWALLLAAVTSLTFHGPRPMPWYDQDAAIWVVVAALTFDYTCDREKLARRLGALAVGALIALAFHTKSNYGVASGIMFFLIFLAERPLTIKSFANNDAFLFSAVGFVLGNLMVFQFLVPSAADYYHQAFAVFDAKDRMFSKIGMVGLWGVFRNSGYMLFPLFALFLASLSGREWTRANRAVLGRLVAVTAFSLFISWTSTTDWRFSLVAVGIALLYAFVLADHLPDTSKELFRIRRTGKLIASVAIIVTGFYGARLYQKSFSFRLPTDTVPSDNGKETVFTTKTFKGWFCSTTLCQSLDALIQFLKRDVPISDSIFVFPDSTIIYGMADRPSLLNVPDLFQIPFERNPSIFDKDIKANFLRRIQSSPPDWLVLHERPYAEKFGFPEAIIADALTFITYLKLDDWLRGYSRVIQFGEYSVWKKRKI